MQKISNLTLSLDEDESILYKKVAKEMQVSEKQIKYLKIVRKSIDARRRDNIKFIYTVEADTVIPNTSLKEEFETTNSKKKIIVVGLGPCGLFCALNLARCGFKPLVLERGESVENRTKTVESFCSGGALNTQSNIQFGEGGAGAFSDGKLNTQVNNRHIAEVLEDFVRFGAPEEIAYSAKPHIGSDKLPKVVSNIRNEIINLGGTVKFNTKIDGLEIKNDKVVGVRTSEGVIDCDYVVLAIGHSARDTFESLYKSGVQMEQKEFAVGVRCEQLQSLVNERQYGKFASNPKLEPADFKLVSHCGERSAFSFCMCPGGEVMPATSEENQVVVNGMSNYLRNGKNANSAIVVQIKKSDFDGESPLAGIYLQRQMERKAFELGGKNYKVPIQLAEDFVKDRNSTSLKGVLPSYRRGYEFARLENLFPTSVSDTLKKSLIDMDAKFKGIASMGAVLTGVESRTSSPLRILRGENMESVNVQGLFPCGEGCGYAGGIMSASIDGIKVAEAIFQKEQN